MWSLCVANSKIWHNIPSLQTRAHADGKCFQLFGWTTNRPRVNSSWTPRPFNPSSLHRRWGKQAHVNMSATIRLLWEKLKNVENCADTTDIDINILGPPSQRKLKIQTFNKVTTRWEGPQSLSYHQCSMSKEGTAKNYIRSRVQHEVILEIGCSTRLY